MQPSHPREIDLSRPSAARVYDFLLGGPHNYDIDRVFAADAIRTCPFLPDIARQNRAFLHRVVRHLAEDCEVKQFIDVGAGIPTSPNVHEIAHAIDPEIRVVYVDNDNEAIVTGQRMLQDVPNAASVFGDILQVDLITKSPEVNRLVDFTQPVGLLMVSVLHFVNSGLKPHDLVQRYLGMLSPGSYFAASHVTRDDVPIEHRAQLEELERKYGNTKNPATVRTKPEFVAFFDGLKLVEPGVVHTVDWRSTEAVAVDDPARPTMWAAVGRKP